MEYSIRQLSDLAGISTRTLRYYDEIGLLKPKRVNESGHRFYGEREVELLQQILFYRERDLGLDVISNIIHQPNFDIAKALEEHLLVLSKKQEHILSIIRTVKLTIADLKGEYKMDDKMRFEALKKQLVEENEKAYGTEVRQKYGNEAMEVGNKKILGLSKDDYERFINLGNEIIKALEEAVQKEEDPESETGKRIAYMHKNWLLYTWKEYSPKAHLGLVELYIMDERYQEYYEKRGDGCAEFLIKAVKYWIGLQE